MKRIHIFLISGLLFLSLSGNSQSTKQKLTKVILLSEKMQAFASQAVRHMYSCDTLLTRDECTYMSSIRIDSALILTKQFNGIVNSFHRSHFPNRSSGQSQYTWNLEDQLYDLDNLSSQAIDIMESTQNYFKKYFAVKGPNSYYSKESYNQIIYQKVFFASEKIEFCNDIAMDLYQMYYR